MIFEIYFLSKKKLITWRKITLPFTKIADADSMSQTFARHPSRRSIFKQIKNEQVIVMVLSQHLARLKPL